MGRFVCRSGCGACCIAPSITTPLPGMPQGKPASVACVNLNLETMACTLWGGSKYPQLCKNFVASEENCGSSAQQAMQVIAMLEKITST